MLYWREVSGNRSGKGVGAWGKTDVGDADGLGLARGDELFHLLPCVDMVVRVDDVALAVGELGEAVVVACSARLARDPSYQQMKKRNRYSPSGFIKSGQCYNPSHVSLSPLKQPFPSNRLQTLPARQPHP